MKIVHAALHPRHRSLADPSARLLHVRALPADRSTCAELLAALDDPSLQVARAALDRLVLLGGPEEGAELAARLLTVDIGLVPDCARAVARLDRAAGARVAVAGLGDPAQHVRQAAAVALAELAWPTAREALHQLLGDSAGFVRRVAVEALATLAPTPRTVELLLARLADRDVGVRAAAVGAIVRLSPSPSSALLPVPDDPDKRVRLALARRGRVLSSSMLRRLLTDPEEDVRVAALSGLRETPREELAPAILDRIGDPRARARWAACRALAPLHDPAVDGALVDLLCDGEPLVRAAARRTLRERRPSDAAVFLASRLAECEPARRPTLLYAIAALDAAVADASVRHLDLVHDRASELRLAAVHCCLPGSRDLLAVLAADTDDDVRHAASTRLYRVRAAGRR